MFECFASDRSNAIPLRPVTAATLPVWLEAHPESREWIAAVGFKAEPGTFTFVSGRGGKPEAVLAAPAEGPAIFGLGGLPMALPEGTYRLEARDAAAATAAALGWASAPMRSARTRHRSGGRRRWSGRPKPIRRKWSGS